MKDGVLRLSDAPDAVSHGRRFVVSFLRDHGLDSLVDDASLVATELMTNGVLHAGPPVTVRVSARRHVARIEVEDTSSTNPFLGLPDTDAMTGWGMGVVSALSREWGVEQLDGGKVVWCELVAEPELPDEPPETAPAGAALNGQVPAARGPAPEPGAVPGPAPETWPGPGGEQVPGDTGDADTGDADTRRFAVRLPGVPTDLLLAAKAHVENLVREFTLAAAGAAAGRTAAVPHHLARLIERVVTEFAEPSQMIKRQAVAAASHGDARTDLVLHLSASAGAAGLRYLAALDEADTYARASRLLTLETPPQQQLFRRWYIEAIAAQLRCAALGEPVPPTQPFEARVLAELGTVTLAQRQASRAARLQAVTAGLAAAATAEQVADVVVSQGVAALGASGGGLLLPTVADRFEVPGAVGYAGALVDMFRSQSRHADLPAAVALRTGRTVWIESREERDAYYPELARLEPRSVSVCAAPLTAGTHVWGALRFSFDSPRLFDDDERSFVEALATLTGQALERSSLYAAERDARAAAEALAARLERLQRVTAELTAADDVDTVADIVVRHAVDALGAIMGALSVLVDDDTLWTVGMLGGPTGLLDRWGTFPVAAGVPAAKAVRDNRPVVVPTLAELERDYPALAGFNPQERASVAVPLSIGDRRLGVITMTYPPGANVGDKTDLTFLTALADAAAQAVDRAAYRRAEIERTRTLERLVEAESVARQRTAFLASATTVLSSSLEPSTTVDRLIELLVPRLADWASIHLFDASRTPVAAGIGHRDPAVAAAVRPSLAEGAYDVTASGKLADVFATGRSRLYPQVPDRLADQVARLADATGTAKAFRPASAMAVALTVQGRVIGAVVLARTDGDPYHADDLELVEDLAARSAVALDNAQRYTRERDAALTLQWSLLPQRLPAHPNMRFAWRYLPGAEGALIGGDWYDVIPLDDGRVGLLIGDVMGRGLSAAAVMGQLRASARAHASADTPPAALLAGLDQAVGRLEQSQITTCLYGVLDPTTRLLTVASAGHLPPLVASPDGGGYFLDVDPGAPLGAGVAGYPELHTELPEGATLLLYTDGLVEERARPVDEGLAALRRVVQAPLTNPESLCDAALSAMGRDASHEDDTALLAVTVVR